MIEQKQYREYLKAQYEEEKRREKELEKIIDEEVEKQFQKRLAQWRAERQARKALLEKVIKERQMQINDKILRNQERERELEQEKAEINRMIEFYKNQEKEEKLEAYYKTKKYGDDLVNQMQYNALQKDLVSAYIFKKNKIYKIFQFFINLSITMRANLNTKVM
jgi:hypothetical protein